MALVIVVNVPRFSGVVSNARVFTSKSLSMPPTVSFTRAFVSRVEADLTTSWMELFGGIETFVFVAAWESV
ncbi:hypothetical protein D3C71_1949640 [compost metagenome]